MGNNNSSSKKSLNYPPKTVASKQSKMKKQFKNYNQQGSQILSNSSFENSDYPPAESISLNYNDDEIISCKETKELTSTNDFKTLNISEIVNFDLTPYHKTYNPSNKNKLQTQVMAKLSAADVEIETKASIDLICVIDKSGSMTGEKIKLLINSFNYIFDNLGPRDRVSVVSFSDKAERLTPLLCMNNENKSNMLKTLNEVKASGGTDIALGIQHAMEIISQRRYVNEITSVLVLSDGLDNRADKKIETLLKKYNNCSYTINTFGYGSDHDPELMSKIASFKDGSFYFIDKLDTVDECFVDCLGGLVSIIAEDIDIQIKPNADLPNVKIVKAYGPSNFWNLKNERSYAAKQLNIISGKNYHFVFDVEIDFKKNFPAGLDSILIASGSCQFKGVSELDKNKVFTKEAECHLCLTKDNIKEDKDSLCLEVLVQYYRVKSTEVIEQAIKLAEVKKFEEAQKILTSFKEDVQYSLVKDKELIMNLIKDIEAAIKNVTPVSYDKMGKHFLVENLYCNIRERSNKNSNVVYQNSRQMAMQSDLLSKKK